MKRWILSSLTLVGLGFFFRWRHRNQSAQAEWSKYTDSV
ncbi:hypothetical protein DFO66_102310 [Brevibacterium sanguinis]|uniref:Uncharacterized protein n=2 Tax=Brevibacterium TaxID=1696 RepID=A0A366IM26_9MICO|nr:hypothetical protein DFO66_102310 [Brevibacterium sanguinis]RBP73781.1 hypothetical protein DFO65_102310 [Brevibacterium celere]